MGDNSSISWDGRGANRLGHWGASWLIAAICAAIFLGVHPLPAGTALAMWLPTALFVTTIIGWLNMRQHDRRLCEICAGAMPLNAAEVASRYRRRFLVAHASASRRLIICYLVVLLGSNALLFFGTPGRAGWAVVQLTMIYLVLSYSSHRRFQPWCPQCSGGGGGDEHVDVPDPMPQDGLHTV